MQGISVLTGLLESQVLCNITDKENIGTGEASERRDVITVPQASLAGEILKSFFNIVIHTKMEELEVVSVVKVKGPTYVIKVKG